MEELLKRQTSTPVEFNLGREIVGRTTALTCPCGGVLHEVRYLPDVPAPVKPRHKKRRILKKLLKRWAAEALLRGRASAFMFSMQRPMFRCTACGKKEGFYRAMGRNLFTVQPLPQGAAPIFLRVDDLDLVRLLSSEPPEKDS